MRSAQARQNAASYGAAGHLNGIPATAISTRERGECVAQPLGVLTRGEPCAASASPGIASGATAAPSARTSSSYSTSPAVVDSPRPRRRRR